MTSSGRRLFITGSSGLLGGQVMAQTATMGFQRIWGTWHHHRPAAQPPCTELIRLDITGSRSDLGPHVVRLGEALGMIGIEWSDGLRILKCIYCRKRIPLVDPCLL